jgi:hypothetical protein
MADSKRGSEKVKGALRANALKWVIIALVFIAAGVAGLIAGLTDEESDGSPAVVGGVIGLIGVIVLLCNLKNLIAPQKSKYVKKNPKLLEMADEHFGNIKYKDKMVTISDNYFSCTKQPWLICGLGDVYQVYYKVTKYMAILTIEKLLMFRCGPMDFRVNVWGTSQKKVDACTQNVALNCPNAKFGYTPANNSYANTMKAQWKP